MNPYRGGAKEYVSQTSGVVYARTQEQARKRLAKLQGHLFKDTSEAKRAGL